MKFKYIFYLIAIQLLTSCFKSSEKVDLIVHANILNSDFSGFETVFLIINEGKIIDIQHDLSGEYVGKTIQNEYYVYPGFIDGHCHFLGYSRGLESVDLVGTKSFQDVIERLIDSPHSKNVNVVYGRGWDQNDWVDKQFPDREILDSIFPSTPVVLSRIDGHAVLVNQAALDLYSINSSTTIAGGVIEKREGRLTGILIDNAADLVKQNNRLPSMGSVLKAEQNCFEVGLTTLSEAGLSLDEIRWIDSLQSADKLKMRFYAMASDDSINFNYFLTNGPIEKDRLNVRSFKFYADGALGSRGACLLEPYSDKPDEFGLFLKESDYYLNKAIQLKKAGFQMNTHAIGDSGNKVMLNIYQNVLDEDNDLRWRIEHAQIIEKSDLEIFNKWNVIPSVQPTHATSDMYWAEERLGHDRMHRAYSYRSLLNAHGKLSLGTDFPVEQIDPISTFYAAVFRKDHSGYPNDGFLINESISRGEALKGMTIWAAFANFEEDKKGSIEIGKFADLVILDKNLLECDESEILNAKVISTILNGEVVFHLD